jgi:hypothetical protein
MGRAGRTRGVKRKLNTQNGKGMRKQHSLPRAANDHCRFCERRRPFKLCRGTVTLHLRTCGHRHKWESIIPGLYKWQNFKIY